MPYSSTFQQYLTNPRHVGEIENADASSEEVNPVCGDRLRLSLRIREGRIAAARFLAYGCAPTLACGAALAEMLQDLAVPVALGLTRQDILQAVGGLPSRKQHAAALAIEALHAALGRGGFAC